MTASTMSTAFSSAAWCRAGGPPGWTLADGGATDAAAAEQRQEIDAGRPAEDQHQQQAAEPRPPARIPMPPELPARPRCCPDSRSSTSYAAPRSASSASAQRHCRRIRLILDRRPEAARRRLELSIPAGLLDDDGPPFRLLEPRHRQDAARDMCPRRIAVHTPDDSSRAQSPGGPRRGRSARPPAKRA